MLFFRLNSQRAWTSNILFLFQSQEPPCLLAFFNIYSIYLLQRIFLSRGRAAAAREAHNLEDGGSNPSPATILNTPAIWPEYFIDGSRNRSLTSAGVTD